MNHTYLTITTLKPTMKHYTVCEGTSISLPTECPGKPMTGFQEVNVANNERDYINGKWRNV